MADRTYNEDVNSSKQRLHLSAPVWERVLAHVLTLFVLMLSPLSAHAYQYNDLERQYTLGTAYGIAAPAFSTATWQNPAGLIYNERLKLLFAGASSTSSFSSVGLGGSLLMGNGLVGGAIGFQTFNDQVSGGNSLGLLNVGLAAYVPKFDLALGFTGAYRLFGNSYAGHWGSGTWGLDFGLLFSPRGTFRVGITAYDLLSSTRALGAGVGFELSPWALLAVDATTLTSLRGIAIKPALTINLYDFNLTAGYGLGIETSSTPWTPLGASFGLAFWVGSHLNLQFYFNELSYLYAGLSLIL